MSVFLLGGKKLFRNLDEIEQFRELERKVRQVSEADFLLLKCKIEVVFGRLNSSQIELAI